MAIAIPKAYLTGSNWKPYLPPTIQSDWTNYLFSDMPNDTGTYVWLRDWYEQFEDEYEKTEFRAEMFPIAWKSKVGLSDASVNFYTNYDIPILKGDYVINEAGEVYMLNWTISKEINSQHTQAVKCNANVQFYRHVKETWTKDGRLDQPEHDEIIAPTIPALLSEYAGRPDYSVAENMPGINPDMLSICQVQYNDVTKNIRINDQFKWGPFTYRVINITYTEVAITGETGILGFNMRRVGGEYDPEAV